MMTTEKPKRPWRPWYRMPIELQPICPKCNVACVATKTVKVDQNRVSVTHRKCPECGRICKTTAHHTAE